MIMALQDEDISKSACQENREGKQKLFSFRSLLRKSRSSRTMGEAIKVDASGRLGMPTSKSCDVKFSTIESMDRRSKTYLLWKLLPPPGKTLARNGCQSLNEKMCLRTSFSCNDVCNANTSQTAVRSSESIDVLDRIRECGTSRCGRYRLRDCATGPEVDSRPTQDYLSPLHRAMCKLCLTMVPACGMYTLHDCRCAFCLTCLRQYLRINIREGNVTVTCPDADCEIMGKILISEIREIAGEDAFYMFERYKLNLDVELDPNRVWCPSAGCETICSFQSSPDPNSGVSVLCLSCRTRFCSLCKLGWHGTMSCEDARKNSNDEIEFSASDDENPIKRCPNCRIPIEKDDGCAQMMCYRCKHVFCWHCLASLDDDFLLRHYDKGPCRNKLGHSRASMIWHRTQVVGIFAGFSFLLLMASPFLLLAAPCFFCCRCKNRFFYEEATPL